MNLLKFVVHNDDHCHLVSLRTSLGIFFKTALKFGFFILNALFTSKTLLIECNIGFELRVQNDFSFENFSGFIEKEKNDFNVKVGAPEVLMEYI